MLRVWDLLLSEGRDTLLRVGLAILKLSEKRLLAADNPQTIQSAIRAAPALVGHDADRLLKEVTAKRFASLSPAVRESHLAEIEAERAALEERRKKRHEMQRQEKEREAALQTGWEPISPTAAELEGYEMETMADEAPDDDDDDDDDEDDDEGEQQQEGDAAQGTEAAGGAEQPPSEQEVAPAPAPAGGNQIRLTEAERILLLENLHAADAELRAAGDEAATVAPISPTIVRGISAEHEPGETWVVVPKGPESGAEAPRREGDGEGDGYDEWARGDPLRQWA